MTDHARAAAEEIAKRHTSGLYASEIASIIARHIDAATEGLREENTKLRAALAVSKDPCIYCQLPADEMAKCKSGFPGCSRADDMQGCPEFGASMEAHDLQLRLAACERERDRCKREIDAAGTNLFDYSVLERLDRLESAEAETRRLREALEKISITIRASSIRHHIHAHILEIAAAALQAGRTPHDDTPPQ